jgi:hypothetical protein
MYLDLDPHGASVDAYSISVTHWHPRLPANLEVQPCGGESQAEDVQSLRAPLNKNGAMLTKLPGACYRGLLQTPTFLSVVNSVTTSTTPMVLAIDFPSQLVFDALLTTQSY